MDTRALLTSADALVLRQRHARGSQQPLGACVLRGGIGQSKRASRAASVTRLNELVLYDNKQQFATMLQLTRLPGVNSDGITWEFRGHVNEQGLRHGHGICESFARNTGDLCSTYTGHWANGVRSGFGLVQFVRGHFYHGEWCNDEPHGQGVYYSPDFDPLQR